MEWLPPLVEQGKEEGRVIVEEHNEEYPFWLRPGNPPRVEHKLTGSTQTQVWVIGNEEEELGDEEEESSGSEDAPEGGQLPPEFLAGIVDRLARTLGQN